MRLFGIEQRQVEPAFDEHLMVPLLMARGRISVEASGYFAHLPCRLDTALPLTTMSIQAADDCQIDYRQGQVIALESVIESGGEGQTGYLSPVRFRYPKSMTVHSSQWLFVPLDIRVCLISLYDAFQWHEFRTVDHPSPMGTLGSIFGFERATPRYSEISVDPN